MAQPKADKHQKNLSRYKWFKCENPSQTPDTPAHYYTNTETGASSWEEPQEPYWVYNIELGGPDPCGLQYPAGVERKSLVATIHPLTSWKLTRATRAGRGANISRDQSSAVQPQDSRQLRPQCRLCQVHFTTPRPAEWRRHYCPDNHAGTHSRLHGHHGSQRAHRQHTALAPDGRPTHGRGQEWTTDECLLRRRRSGQRARRQISQGRTQSQETQQGRSQSV